MPDGYPADYLSSALCEQERRWHEHLAETLAALLRGTVIEIARPVDGNVPPEKELEPQSSQLGMSSQSDCLVIRPKRAEPYIHPPTILDVADGINWISAAWGCSAGVIGRAPYRWPGRGP